MTGTRSFLLLLISLALVACATDTRITSVTINSVHVPVELAVTAQQREFGLMNRTHLDGGMLFVYTDQQPRYFWMKNTLIPLDMLFIDKQGTIVTIQHATPCISDPCTVYPSLPAQYVLEVPENFTRDNGILEGMHVSFS